ncbi:SIMPL domain-containing protein [Frondihabitans cladoniiphilus]|uniref:SIMPL domain-containing protein n=1 Tax=Frondihabitans cladoniiphilus TaxID=715785 RepID=A0ABP8VWR1_9MICO
MTTFVVAGDATISHPAERAIVRIQVALTSTDRGAASRAAVEAHNVVASEAAAHHASGVATWWQADQVATWSYEDHAAGAESPITRYRAQSQLSVTFQDFAVLATWVGRLLEWPSVQVQGIDWLLTVSKQAELLRAARIQAVEDAVTKAADYAAALELGTPALDAVFEEGLRPGLGGGGGSFGRAAMKMSAAPLEGGSLDLKPGDIEVTARITADFTA